MSETLQTYQMDYKHDCTEQPENGYVVYRARNYVPLRETSWFAFDGNNGIRVRFCPWCRDGLFVPDIPEVILELDRSLIGEQGTPAAKEQTK